MASAATTLTSSVDRKQVACPGEVVTYTCTVGQAIILEWTAEPFLTESNRLQFASTTSLVNRVLECGDSSSSVQCANFDFEAALTSVGAVGNNGAADMTSTFRFTASARVNRTVVECRGLTTTAEQIASITLGVAGAAYIIHSVHSRCMCTIVMSMVTSRYRTCVSVL